jgi:hypothetical protein
MATIRIGNGAGFAGDNLDAPRLLCEAGRLDYLTLEYLAELTMSILAHQKKRDPEAGYVTDFCTVAESLLPSLQSQPALRIVTNAGGINPAGCVRVVAAILSQAGLDDLPLASVTGDDLMEDLDRHLAEGEPFAHLDTGQSLGDLRSRVVSANAYLGASGIVEALDQGARIVVTGRVADASLAVGPVMHEFTWNRDDWDRVAAATVAGHLIECGAQVSGGYYADWTEAMPLADVGYPIAEISDEGALLITKPPETGGAVTTATVAEQLVYEIGDPSGYITPDVVADFANVRLAAQGTDQVRVEGARGRPAPDRYKVSLAYEDGYMAAGTLLVCGAAAESKARRSAAMILERVHRAGYELARTNVEVLGSGDSVPGIWPRQEAASEVLLRMSVHDASREAVERWTRELAPLITSGPPGIAGYAGRRPQPQRVLAYWPTTIARDQVAARVVVRTAKDWLA